MEVFGEQIAAVTAPVEAKAARRSIESLLSQVREAKTYDVYHSTDRPPIVVPPTVLVQRPPEAWGEGR